MLDFTSTIVLITGGTTGTCRAILISPAWADLAPHVRASLAVMDRDAKRLRGERPVVFTNCMTGRAWTP